jgi:hypothetical protein
VTGDEPERVKSVAVVLISMCATGDEIEDRIEDKFKERFLL